MVFISLLSVSGQVARAQVSPGELSLPHANLEGLSNCTECHTLGAGPDKKKCLKCHVEIKQRLAVKKGYHFFVKMRLNKTCSQCHSDHNGRDFKMIFWPNGIEKFDHRQAGYVLEGKHAKLKCAKCHRPENILHDPRKVNKKVDVAKTFLGLSQKCLSCHEDKHQGQLAKDCLKCHNHSDWKPALNFDHNTARFRLTGKHSKADCAKCHPTKSMPGSGKDGGRIAVVKFTGLDFATCGACHEDTHRGRFGKNCERCHSTDGWRQFRQKRFDHSLTKFPLLGRHAQVACEQCHKPGRPKRGIPFAKCHDCHADVHRGQLSHRPDSERCENCHSVSGFAPANFGLEDHNKSRFKLTGAHEKIACKQCHKPVRTKSGRLQTQFRFDRPNCQACHEDVHKGQFNKKNTANGCESCHGTLAWSKTHFDHDTSKFQLIGRHERVACRECHKMVDIGSARQRLLFRPIDTACSTCHKDVHAAQFAEQQCDQCHASISWFALLFDHDQDSKFKLEGAHAQTACAKCHKWETHASVRFIRFKPIDNKCIHCHGN